MSELDPERLLRSLVEHRVEFCVIGAVAAWLQGNPTVTLGLDVMPRRELDNAERLAAALNELGARVPGAEAAAERYGLDAEALIAAAQAARAAPDRKITLDVAVRASA